MVHLFAAGATLIDSPQPGPRSGLCDRGPGKASPPFCERSPTIHSLLVRFVLVMGLAWSLAACGSPTPAPPTETARPAAQQTPPPSPPSESGQEDSGPAHISGHVVSASDVSGQPDVPLVRQVVIALPLATLRDMADQPLTEADLRFFSHLLPGALPGAILALTDARGTYALELAPGTYALCLAYPAAGTAEGPQPTDFPLEVRGCGRLDLATGQARTVDVSVGFGEILLIEE